MLHRMKASNILRIVPRETTCEWGSSNSYSHYQFTYCHLIFLIYEVKRGYITMEKMRNKTTKIDVLNISDSDGYWRGKKNTPLNAHRESIKTNKAPQRTLIYLINDVLNISELWKSKKINNAQKKKWTQDQPVNKDLQKTI